MPRIRVVLIVAILIVASALTSPRALAADTDDSAKFFDTAQQDIADVRKKLGSEVESQDLARFRDSVSSIDTQADALAADRAPKLAALDARIAELGPAPAAGSPPEAADIAAQRTALGKQRATIDAEIKRAKLLSLESEQLLTDIEEARRANFQARLSQRTASPLTPTFWTNIGGAIANDSARLAALRTGVAAAIADAFAPDNRAYAIGGLIVGMLLIVFGRWWAERALMRVTADRVPHGRLRRSALAFTIVVVTTAFAGFGAHAIVVGLNWHSAFSDTEQQLARSLVAAVSFGSFVAGLGRGLLSAARPSWRLTPLSDHAAQALRLFPWLIGAAIALTVMLRRINTLVGASLSATIATLLLTTVLYAGLVLWALARVARARRVDRAGNEPPADAHVAPAKGPTAKASASHAPATTRPLWTSLAVAALWIASLLALVSAAIGYVAFAQFVASQIVWIAIVSATCYLIVHLIEDIFATLVAARATWVHETLGVRTRTIEQVAVVLSGAFRVVAFLFALSLILTRFGNAPGELLSRGGAINANGFSIGSIEVTPTAIAGAIFVFLIGLLAIRTLQRWLHDRYLPTTSLDPAMRSSVTTLLGYAGIVVVVAFALSELGLSVERIAWVASALSVGIGFGLQAVVQNFVSGLILLAERPVKVGDWVALGDVEGDIRRISVRATEIQMGDRSTLIVPNSELITKTVRNVTLANAQGRVQVKLPMPLDTDADKVMAAMRDAFEGHAATLADPAPSVTVDGIQAGALVFSGVAFIDNPRKAGGVKSELILDVLARLRAANVSMVAPQEVAYRAIDNGPAQPFVPGTS